MGSILSLFILVVAVSYLLIWRIYSSLKHKAILLAQQVEEKAELLSYAQLYQRKATDQVIEVKASKKQLLTIINHEIRTPLNGILGMVSLLADTALTQEQKDYNETIRGCGETLITTINDIFMRDMLASSKVDDEKRDLDKKNFDIRNSLDEVFELFAVVAARINIELVHHIDPKVPLTIVGDSLRMRQVLMNLIENAIMFTREGEIYVRIDLTQKTDILIELGFEVHDNGLGMSNDKIKLLSLNQNSPAAQRGHSSHDNGLLLSKRIIESMGGRLDIDSMKGKGTVAKFSMQFQPSEHMSRINTENAMLGGKKILIVEDNVRLQLALKEEVIHWGSIPLLASSGDSALQLLADNVNIDVAIVEMQMPDMDGLNVSELISQQYPAVPIILLTTGDDVESKKRPELFNSVILKPVRYQLLAEHIATAMTHKEQSMLDGMNNPTQKLSVDFAEKFPLRILIAEDNRVNQKLTLRVLAKLGYNADIAQDGTEVLEEVSKINYDLILMDVKMPEMDGLEATRMIRLCLNVQPIIIAMTANAMQGDREECIQAGMDDYLSKPVRVEDLVVLLEKWSVKVRENKK